LLSERQRPVRIFVDVPDLPPNRVTSHIAANYIHAVLKLQALRRELSQVALEVANCKKAIACRHQGAILLSGAQTLLKELGVEPDVQ
jgi:hypothetical protein